MTYLKFCWFQNSWCLWILEGNKVIDMTNLRTSNYIDDENCERICNSLKGCVNSLESLNLGGNSIGGRGAAALGTLLVYVRVRVEQN